MTTQAHGLITKKPGVCGGSATIAGTRIRVADIVSYWRLYEDVGRIQEALPHLDQSQIVAALTYYDDNSSEIEGLIKEEEALIAADAKWPKHRST